MELPNEHHARQIRIDGDIHRHDSLRYPFVTGVSIGLSEPGTGTCPAVRGVHPGTATASGSRLPGWCCLPLRKLIEDKRLWDDPINFLKKPPGTPGLLKFSINMVVVTAKSTIISCTIFVSLHRMCLVAMVVKSRLSALER